MIIHALDDLPGRRSPPRSASRPSCTSSHSPTTSPPPRCGGSPAKVLDVVAPEISEEAERKALEREEQLAAERTRSSLTPLGDGTTRITGRISDAAAGRLRTYLEAFASPRRTASETDGERIPTPRLLGLALTDLLEALPAEVLPAHGGTATTVTVHLNLDQLTASLEKAGIATLDTGDTITAAQARRLACQAKILPAVLGGKSEVLDLGRSRRLHSAAQRKAIRIQQTQCQTDGCTVPAAWCETHHPHAWSPAARPTSTTPHCSAAITTTEPTTPATSPNSCQRRLPLHQAHIGRPQILRARSGGETIPWRALAEPRVWHELNHRAPNLRRDVFGEAVERGGRWMLCDAARIPSRERYSLGQLKFLQIRSIEQRGEFFDPLHRSDLESQQWVQPPQRRKPPNLWESIELQQFEAREVTDCAHILHTPHLIDDQVAKVGAPGDEVRCCARAPSDIEPLEERQPGEEALGHLHRPQRQVADRFEPIDIRVDQAAQWSSQTSSLERHFATAFAGTPGTLTGEECRNPLGTTVYGTPRTARDYSALTTSITNHSVALPGIDSPLPCAP